MGRHHTLTVSFARTRAGRALLHALCLARGRHLRWHVGGIVRELFGPDPRHPNARSGRLNSTAHPPGLMLLGAALQIQGLMPAAVAGGMAHDGSAITSLKFEVVADVLSGQTARVRNPKTKFEYYAKVQDDQTVCIPVQGASPGNASPSQAWVRLRPAVFAVALPLCHPAGAAHAASPGGGDRTSRTDHLN